MARALDSPAQLRRDSHFADNGLAEQVAGRASPKAALAAAVASEESVELVVLAGPAASEVSGEPDGREASEVSGEPDGREASEVLEAPGGRAELAEPDSLRLVVPDEVLVVLAEPDVLAVSAVLEEPDEASAASGESVVPADPEELVESEVLAELADPVEWVESAASAELADQVVSVE